MSVVGSIQSVIERGLRAAYQPIVELDTGEVIAFEALARGPAGSEFERPDALFAAAARLGLTADLDWACRAAALRGPLQGLLPPEAALFVNIEPAALGRRGSAEDEQVFRRAPHELSMFAEVTERALTGDPAQLLESIERLRRLGWGIALDDVGADRRSLALLPLLRPDVVKLDMSLIHGHPSRSSGEVMNAVCAYAEQTGAAIVAEGIEHECHVIAAQSLGATFAQGWYFGRPGPLTDAAATTRVKTAKLGVTARRVAATPIELVGDPATLRVGRKDILLSVSRGLEAQARQLGEHAVVLAALQHVRHFTPATQRLYASLGAQTALTVALGAGVPDPPAPGVRGANLATDDPLIGDWDVVVLGPHFAGALVALDLGDDGPDAERRFAFRLTFERALVIDIAASLISRVSAVPAAAGIAQAA